MSDTGPDSAPVEGPKDEHSGADGAPTRTEVEHRTRNMRGLRRILMRGAAAAGRAAAALPGVAAWLGRSRTLLLERR